jgi:hypothetical protein
MKKGEKKKRDKALKKRTQRKRSGNSRSFAGSLRALWHLRQARTYPIEGCWVQQGWNENGLAIVVVARSQPDGDIAFGTFLVDYYCLGLKDTYCSAAIRPERFHHEILPRIFRGDQLISISPALAHEIIYGGIEYAARYGFRPQEDFEQSQFILDPPDVHPCSGAATFGHEGKPFYVSGPFDDRDAIVQQLLRTAGEGNFDFLVHLGDVPADYFDAEE